MLASKAFTNTMATAGGGLQPTMDTVGLKHGGGWTIDHIYVMDSAPARVKPAGDPVVVTLIRSCGHCHYCAQAEPVACDSQFHLDAETPLHTSTGEKLEHGLRTGARVAILPPVNVDFLQPTSIEEALDPLARHGDDAKVIGGGTAMAPNCASPTAPATAASKLTASTPASGATAASGVSTWP